MKKLIPFAVLLMVFLSACASTPSGVGVSTPIVMTAEASTVIPDMGGTQPPFATPGSPTLIPTLAGGLSVTELKYRLLEKFPDFFFCDPDFYPVAREDEMSLALQNFPGLQANEEEFQAILNRMGPSGQTIFTDEQMLDIYREHKKLNAIYFQLVGDKYQFQIQTGVEGQQGAVSTGTIDGGGSIDILKREQSFPACPICLAAGTLIDTPRGPIRVEDLREGDLVWTQDEAGGRVIASILRTGQVRVPASHQMVHIFLADGRELWASSGHPTSDGRRLGDLQAGEILDGARIAHLDLTPYNSTYTFDILPSSTTGSYWANGILMRSTLSSP